MLNLIEILLNEAESSTLDFKEKQYTFEHATDEQKSELLKDIIAFANAWRRTDSYILIGVKEIKGSRSLVVGIDNHLDDAIIQQFVNSKLQKPLRFSYQTVEYEGKKVALIHIPLQERPFYLRRNYGKLKADTIYTRRGSSTVIAKPDEIAKFSQEDITSLKKQTQDGPILKLSFSKEGIIDVLKVLSIKELNRKETIDKLKSVQLREADLALVFKHKDWLDSTIEKHHDGTLYNPYEVRRVTDYVNTIQKNIELAKKDFKKFTELYGLSLRSVEMADSFYAKKKEKLSRTYLKIDLAVF